MSWSDAARNRLESHLAALRARLGPDDGDPDEVVGDCRRHVEAALAGREAVEVADVETVLARLGPVAGLAPPAPAAPVRTGWAWWLLVVANPIAALAIGLEMGVHDLLPSWLHIVMIALLPASGILTALRPALRWLPLLHGLCLGTALYYAAALLPLTPFACIGVLMLGAGLVLMSPQLACIPLFAAVLRAPRRVHALLACAAAVAVLGLADLRAFRTLAELDRAVGDRSARPAAAAALAAFGDERLLESVAGHQVRGLRSGPVLLIGWGLFIDRDAGGDEDSRAAVADELLFRISGRIQPRPGRASTWWDEQRGRQSVGQPIAGLGLRESRLDGSLDGDAGVAYVEWLMVFANDGARAQEGRCELVLPPGGVVSRLTLWVAGEPREAAVGSRAQAVEAYRQVAVRQSRDPALVTTLGGDRVLLQVFPVPANGTLQVRLGITAPMGLTADRREARLLLPAIAHHNLDGLPHGHASWLAARDGVRLLPDGTHSADLRTTVPIDSSTLVAAGRGQAAAAWGNGVLQTWEDAPRRPVVVVLDASSALAPWAGLLRRELPRVATVQRWVVARDAAVADDAAFDGGHDNSAVVAEALAGAAGSGAAVLWIHGPQPLGRAGAGLRMAMERSPGAELIEVAVADGPVAALAESDGAGPVRSLLCRPADLPAALAALPGPGDAPLARRRTADAAPPGAAASGEHLVRLHAVDEIRRLLAGPQPDRAAALALAMRHRLATPASGLVVLETRAQEVALGLDPASGTVPAIPEPETWAMLALAALLLAVLAWRHRRQRPACA